MKVRSVVASGLFVPIAMVSLATVGVGLIIGTVGVYTLGTAEMIRKAISNEPCIPCR